MAVSQPLSYEVKDIVPPAQSARQDIGSNCTAWPKKTSHQDRPDTLRDISYIVQRGDLV